MFYAHLFRAFGDTWLCSLKFSTLHVSKTFLVDIFLSPFFTTNSWILTGTFHFSFVSTFNFAKNFDRPNKIWFNFEEKVPDFSVLVLPFKEFSANKSTLHEGIHCQGFLEEEMHIPPWGILSINASLSTWGIPREHTLSGGILFQQSACEFFKTKCIIYKIYSL